MENLIYKPLDIENELEVNSLVKWDNDDELYHFIIPTKDEHSREYSSFDSKMKQFHDYPEQAKGIFILYLENRPIGNFSIQFNPRHLMKKDLDTSWLGLTIGEKEYWGSGAAQKAMEFFEIESRSLKAKRVELGVFEFNHRAIKFYEKQGYKEIGRLNEFTYWNGNYWDDIRMEKILGE